MQDLLIAKRDLRLSREIKRLSRYDGLIIDDLGYVQQSREDMEVVFTLVKCILRSRTTTSSWASAVSAWLLPRPGITENQNILFPTEKAAVQQHPELPGRFRRQPLEIEILQRLLQRQRRVFQQPLYPGLPPLPTFP